MNQNSQQIISRHLYRNALRHSRAIKADLESLTKVKDSIKLQPTIQKKEYFLPEKITPQQDRLGRIIFSEPLRPPFCKATDLITLPIKTLDDNQSPFNAVVTATDINTSELNLSVIMGKWFDWNYNPNSVNTSPIITNTTCCHLAKCINITPFDRDVYVVARTSGTLPIHTFSAVFNDWEPVEPQYGSEQLVIQMAGVQADFSTSLSYLSHGNQAHSSTTGSRIIRALKTTADGDVDHVYENPSHTCLIKLPAGTSEFVYSTYLIGQAFTSNDINNYLHNSHINQYGLAMLDLRNEANHRNILLIWNPLSGQIWEPSGGLKLTIDLEFYEVQSLGGI